MKVEGKFVERKGSSSIRKVFYLFQQAWHIPRGGFPDFIPIDQIISMNEMVAHSCHGRPGNLCLRKADFRGKSLDGFADHRQLVQNGRTSLPIIEEAILSETIDKRGDELRRVDDIFQDDVIPMLRHWRVRVPNIPFLPCPGFPSVAMCCGFVPTPGE